MTIYDFIEMVNDNHEMAFTLFDCNSEGLVFMATEEAKNTCEFSREDLMCSHYADYEICSMDMWVDNGKIHIEFNIEVEDEDEWEEPDWDDEDYIPSAENGDYSPSNPWDAPGMKMSDFI